MRKKYRHLAILSLVCASSFLTGLTSSPAAQIPVNLVLPDSVWGFKAGAGTESQPWATSDGAGTWTITNEACVINGDTLDGGSCKNAKIKFKAGVPNKWDLIKIQFDNVWADSLDSIKIRFFDVGNKAGSGPLYCIAYDTSGNSVLAGESLFVDNYAVTTSIVEWIGPFKLPDSLLALVSGSEFQGKPLALRFYTSSGSTREIKAAELQTQLFFKPGVVNNPPVLDSIGSKTVDEGQTLEFRISSSDPDGDSIILDTLNVPPNASFVDSGNGAISVKKVIPPCW